MVKMLAELQLNYHNFVVMTGLILKLMLFMFSYCNFVIRVIFICHRIEIVCVEFVRRRSSAATGFGCDD